MTFASSRLFSSSQLLALALLLLLGAVWGGGTSIAKFLSVSGVPPIGAVFWQTLGAGVLLLLVCRQRGVSVRFDGRYLRYYAFNGIVGLAIPSTNMMFVTGHIPAGVMAVILTLSPVLTYLAAMTLRMEAVDARRAGGIALGFVGALVLVLPAGSLPERGMLPFALLAFLTPACYMASNVYAELRRPAGADAITLATGAVLAAAAGLLVGALATGQFYPIWTRFTLVEGVMLAYMALTAIAYVSLFTVLRIAGSVYLSQVAYVITVTGLGWGALVFEERPSAWIWLAVVLIFTGVALVNLGRRQAPVTDHT